mmetsp:Transcript_27538/g.69503  ORF Transcript_27538/g.69503 Transcript_27538/m.69503 type:complete len:195 (+) Transcript_27538:121-705(+)|eukprot:CAMPEP_0173434114 /NCGR_PEP_ID=MMETSP1357-20121228/12019_1 /TAXON_ID=77926 /ORGANISM="Hemiselmis rufescens, Strain PCC563" /LENGTH=194 /DNA_ID=CAMNT_0014398925 /DNA_START=93 /DNA_END=677 /DNA_ORIENTATION=+
MADKEKKPGPNLMLELGKVVGYAAAAFVAERMFVNNVAPSAIFSAVTLTIPKAYGMLFITNGFMPSTVCLWMGFGIVGPARRKYGVELPTMYAVSLREGDDAYKFNCCQRAHHNTLETLPLFLLASFLGGIKHPLLCACSGLLWCYSRVVWAKGYATGVPKSRYAAFGSKHVWTALMIPLLCSVSAGLSVLGVI